jgi:hypothetical protein
MYGASALTIDARTTTPTKNPIEYNAALTLILMVNSFLNVYS